MSQAHLQLCLGTLQRLALEAPEGTRAMLQDPPTLLAWGSPEDAAGLYAQAEVPEVQGLWPHSLGMGQWVPNASNVESYARAFFACDQRNWPMLRTPGSSVLPAGAPAVVLRPPPRTVYARPPPRSAAPPSARGAPALSHGGGSPGRVGASTCQEVWLSIERIVVSVELGNLGSQPSELALVPEETAAANGASCW